MKNLMHKTLILGLFFFSATLARADGSRSNREGKTAYVALEPIGLTMMPVNGFRAGYFINPDFVTELSYASGGAKIGSFESKKTMIEAKAKYFIGDNFYLDGGLARESWTVKYSVYKQGTFLESETVKGELANTGVDFHLGNQWQMPGLTIGCDWIGYFLSLSTSSSFGSGTNLDPVDKKSREDSAIRTVGGSSLHLLRFYVGWAF